MMWGSNVPVTRTPDAHWMAEVRYRGTKIVTVSPDCADNTKFADEWMLCATGADGALAMAMGHVILSECFMQHRIPFFDDYVRQFTDLPFHIAAYAVVARKFVEADAARGERVGAKSHHIVGGQPAQLGAEPIAFLVHYHQHHVVVRAVTMILIRRRSSRVASSIPRSRIAATPGRRRAAVGKYDMSVSSTAPWGR